MNTKSIAPSSSSLDLSNINYEFLISRILPNIYIYHEDIHPNINGNLNLNLFNTNNKLIDDIEMNYVFSNEKILLKKANINIKKIGKLNISSLEFIEKDHTTFIRSKMELEIKNQKQFFNRFQVLKKNRIDINKIYFDLDKNLDEKKYYISNIRHSSNKTNLKSEIQTKYNESEISNMQTLTKLINKYLDNTN